MPSNIIATEAPTDIITIIDQGVMLQENIVSPFDIHSVKFQSLLSSGSKGIVKIVI